MKILKTGNKRAAHWWHAKKLTCSTCEQQIELEAEDERSVSWTRLDFSHISITCEMCGDIMHVNRL